jgi:aromatic ring-opening dioxygenase LigB subunit
LARRFVTTTCCTKTKTTPGAIAQLAKEYQARGVAVVAISANSAATHPQDGPDAMAKDAKKFGAPCC